MKLKQSFNNNYTNAANGRKIIEQLPLEHVFGFRKTFEKFSKGLGFCIKFRLVDLQEII